MNSNLEKADTCSTCEFTENLDFLRQIDFFSPLPLESMKVIAYLSQREAYKQGEIIFRKNEDDTKAYFIKSGIAGVLHPENEAKDTIRTFEEGEVIGRLTLLGNTQRLFSLKAMTPVTCVVLTREMFLRIMEQFPGYFPKVLQSVIDGVKNHERRLLSAIGKEDDAYWRYLGVSLL